MLGLLVATAALLYAGLHPPKRSTGGSGVREARREDAWLNKMLKDPNFRTMLNDPNFRGMLKDPTFRAFLSNEPDFSAGLKDPDYRAILKDPNLRALMTELPFGKLKFEAIAKAVLAGTLTPQTSGCVGLPPNLAPATRDGNVYVTHKGKGLVLVLFITWAGKGRNLKGYLFASRPLSRADMLTSAEAAHGPDVEINGPSFPLRAMQESLQVTVERRVAHDWYRVSYLLD